MNNTPDDQAPFLELLSASLDDELTPQQSSELATLLRGDAGYRELFCRWMGLHVMLGARLSRPLGTADRSVTPASLLPPAALPVRGLAARLANPLVWSTLVVGLSFAVYVVTISWNLLKTDGRPLPRVANVGAAQDPVVVATVRGSLSARWQISSEQSEASPPPQSQVNAGEPLQLAEGLVELQLAQGTKLIIEGPASWTIDGENAATLSQGKLVANVPPSAVGFRLRTPHAQIVDLGTEFAVEVGNTSETSVQVLQGEVEYAADGGDSGAAMPLKLHAGEAVRLLTDAHSATVQTQPAVFTPQRFARSLARPSSLNLQLKQLQWPMDAAARQSSELDAKRFSPDKALDGDLTTFTHTSGNDRVAWWQITLPQQGEFAAIVLQNRLDCCRGRLRDIVVKVLDENGREVFVSPPLNPENTLADNPQGFSAGPSQIVLDLVHRTGKPVAGQTIRVERHIPDGQAAIHDGALSLSEVQVFYAAPDANTGFNVGEQVSENSSTSESSTLQARK